MSSPSSSPLPTAPALSPRQLKQVAWLTVGAIALYVFLRWLPTGTNLQHADFRASGGVGSSLEFCDPSNPQFLPVVTVRSPVETRLVPARPPRMGETVLFTLTLKTATGKPIGPADLLESHTRKLHVMAVDPTLTDYQHLHPRPGVNPGEWVFELTPRQAGLYRVFCDFTPRATARGLYASADFEVPAADVAGALTLPAEAPLNWRADHGDFTFRLEPTAGAVKAGAPADLALTVQRHDGGAVVLGEVMGAFAHLVAFDRDRTGFAHLHPNEANLLQPPDAARPRLTFQVTIPDEGRYVVWAQVNLDGSDVYVPFWLDVG